MIAVAEHRRLPPAAIVLLGTVGLLVVSVLVGLATAVVAPLAFLLVVLAVGHRTLLRWENLLGAIVIVILFIPIKRYTLPASLPFELEPYRLLVAVIALGWGMSLFVDPRVQLRRSAFDAPLLLLIAAILASDVANPGRVQAYDSFVAKTFTFFLSFVVVYYFATSAIQSRRALDLILGLLVAGGALVAVASIVERRVAYNVFFDLEYIFPFLQFSGGEFIAEEGRLRVLGSAQHPIALGALFASLMPIGLSLAHRATRLWWIPTVVLGLGVMATASRTPIVMLVVSGAVLLWLKRAEMVRLLPLVVPSVVLVYLVLPGALGTIKGAFLPKGGLIAEQDQKIEEGDPLLAGGRIRLLRPSLEEWSQRPVVGQGYGTRIVGFTEPRRNAPILDNQWLGLLLEIGIVGFGALVWLFLRAVRRLTREARDGSDDDGWLFAGLAAAIASFGIGMFTFDAFSFIQATLVFWILLGLSAAALRLREDEREDERELRPAEGLADPAR